MKLIVGLGNPGKEYEKTRHNIGYMALDKYLGDITWKKEKFANAYKTRIANEDILFIKPTTFMNLSGNAVKYYLSYYKINPKELLIIQDDLDLDLGKIKIKTNSSSGGHNGIKNIIENIGTKDFLRIKIGISKPDNNVVDYVLGKFSKEDLETISNTLELTTNIINDFINNENNETLMNRYN